MALWQIVTALMKLILEQVRELCKRWHNTFSLEKEDGDRSPVKCHIKWVELTVDAFLSLLIEILRHHRVGHMTIITESQEIIYHSLLELTCTSLLNLSKSIYIQKQLIRLHLKIITASFLKEQDPQQVHSSLLKLIQSDALTTTARSWFNTTTKPMLKPTNHTELSRSQIPNETSCGGTVLQSDNEQGLTLDSSLVGTVMRKGVLLILKYSASVLKAVEMAKHSTSTVGKYLLIVHDNNGIIY